MKKIFLKKFAFTIAETVITCTVIGVLTAIVLPKMFHITPDENIAKFKKANNTFYQVISEIVTSGEYVKEGDMYLDQTNNSHEGKIICTAFSDILNVKMADCGNTAGTPDNKIEIGTISDTKKTLDIDCKNAQGNANYIQTSDKIYYYHMYPGSFPSDADGINEIETTLDEVGNTKIYEHFCIDIDGPNGTIMPFGYGVRRDGRIITGARADWWIKRDMQKKENDCCPLNLQGTGDENLCDTDDILCEQ